MRVLVALVFTDSERLKNRVAGTVSHGDCL